jgi:hypothetical protein
MRSIAVLQIALLTVTTAMHAQADYPIVDTGQSACYNDAVEISAPAPGAAYHGQDAQYDGHQPSFTLSGDGLTVSDNVTGLIWQQAADTDFDGDVDSDDKLSWTEFQSHAATLNAQDFGGYSDWRAPTIKELYSLIDFSGIDPSGYSGGTSGLIPFIDTDYFDFAYGDESAGERIIDAQYWSNTQYVDYVFGNAIAIFGVNLADGRIKGYPRDMGPGGAMTQFALFVRGGDGYGINDFIDNGDGTITDQATGLMWMQADNGTGVLWEDALSYAEGLDFAGHDDWRLPNVKELQSIVDYSRSPMTTGSPAIDPLFDCTAIVAEDGVTDYGFYWSGTTHANWSTSPGSAGAYVSFGRAMGYFGPVGGEDWVDVHGAGAQRSDPKSGDPDDYPYGHGPQGDAIRILNFVRCVRDAETSDVDTGGVPEQGSRFDLQATPNPLLGTTTIRFDAPTTESATLEIFDASGRRLRVFDAGGVPGERSLAWDGRDAGNRRVPAGAYYARLDTGAQCERLTLLVIR